MAVWDPWHNSDHYLVLGCLCSAPLMEHTKYLGRNRRPPLCPPTTLTREDRIFAELQRAIPKPKVREARKKAWISVDMWRLIDERVSAQRDIARDQSHIRRLSRAINVRLKEGRSRRTEEAGEEVERSLRADTPLYKEEWHWMKGWYQATFDCAPLPARVTLDRITAEWVDL